MRRCHSVFSCFSPPCPVHWRLVARDRVATRDPVLVLRTSGSAPKFPISMILLRLRLTTYLPSVRRVGVQGRSQYMTRKSFCQSKIRHFALAWCTPFPSPPGGPQHHDVHHPSAVLAAAPG